MRVVAAALVVAACTGGQAPGVGGERAPSAAPAPGDVGGACASCGPNTDGGSASPAPLDGSAWGDDSDAGVDGTDPDAGAADAFGPAIDPDTFAPGETDVVTIIRTTVDRKPISKLIYGVNGDASSNLPAAFMKCVTVVRRGGDRGNSYDWETNVSNGSYRNNYTSDMVLANGVADPNAPAGQDLTMLAKNRAAGRATMVPFVLNDYVAGPTGGNIPWDQPGWARTDYFHRVKLTKPTPYASTPDLNDGIVYTDEHLAYMKAKFADDITAPGPSRLIVGIDNEPDIYDVNFAMLQQGTGAPLLAPNGVQIGTRVTGPDFTKRLIEFTTRVRQIAPQALIVGPSHYHYDGFTTWHAPDPAWSDQGRWFMDDFLADMKSASEAAGVRLLDVWDFHWYPQPMYAGTYLWNIDDTARAMTADEIDGVLQGPRSYWDSTYVESSWITNDHLHGPAMILARLLPRLNAGYPGTKLGVSEYYPGGRGHVSSGLATADTLGVFQRMGVYLGAMWPTGDDAALAWSYGAFELLRDADGNGERYASTDVRVEHPEVAESSVYAGSDTPDRVTVSVINKTDAPRSFGLRIFHPTVLTRVAVYRIDAAHPSPILVARDTLTKNDAYLYAAPPMSAAMLVFTTR